MAGEDTSRAGQNEGNIGHTAGASMEGEVRGRDLPVGVGTEIHRRRWALLGPDDKRRMGLEMGAVLAVGVLPHLAGVLQLLSPQQRYLESMRDWRDPWVGLSMGISGLCIAAVVCWIAAGGATGREALHGHERGIGLEAIGVRAMPVERVLGWALLIVLAEIALQYAQQFLWGVTASFMPSEEVVREMPPQFSRVPALRGELGGMGWLLLTLGFLGSAAGEEVVLRGYMLTRLTRWTGSMPLAVVITSAVFASYHIYQGLGAFIPVFVTGLLLGGMAWWLRSLWPVIVAHAATNVLRTMLWG